ncbi:GC-rich sequence DNA-binding factor-like protein-domain-containing protein [Lasiosphaeris hirsuta]|uniref:GC-rich sequence DNA-binding factor-like protein-domain-containing protein n=1 Tax=Lasiosphaeris hirsuta TaxID=260670 RepID=A0AA40AYG0_9PEZI|nr:GC-rich sequence DNA-binding factor-like protein-domain-containing protein [Lasiosphaeris hirsuta]
MARLDDVRFDPSRLTKASAAEYSSSESDADEDDEYLLPSRNPHDPEFADHNPRKRRRTGRDTKESATLGIFGDESDDDGPGDRWKRRNLRTKGVSFVSSAKAAAPDSDDEEDEDDDDKAAGKGDEDTKMDEDSDYDDDRPTMRPMVADEDDGNEEDEEPGGVGLGFGGGAAAAAMSQGLGWTPSAQQQTPQKHTKPPPKPFVKSTVNASNPLGPGFLPTSAQVPTLLVRDDEPTTPRAAMPSAFSHAKGGKTKINAGSFGARMMAKMGYVAGTGLGKESQGRNVIIEANLRPQKAGLGAVKEKTEQEREEEKRQAALRGEVLVDSDEEAKKKKAARRRKALAGGVGSTPGSGTSTPRRQKPKYVTMDEIKKAAPGLSIPDAFTPILDLTGPGKKMLTSSSGLMTPTGANAPPESTETAESRKLVRRAQNDLMAILEEWQSLQERKAYLELQLQQERQELEEFTASLQGNRSVTTACEAISQPVESGEMDEMADVSWRLGRIISGLKEASASLSDLMLPQIKEELASLAVAAIHPPFKDFLRVWEPLKQPKPSFVDGLDSIRGLLGLDHPAKKTRRKATATPWETMVYKLWLPAVAAAVREWNVREPDQMIAVFEAWQPLLPAFVRTQLLEQDIVRKLDEAVQKWQPKKKSSAHNLPHGWIFPWLPFLPSSHLDPKASTGLVADVKRKFRQLIDVWEFDRGVIPGFKKWKDILRPSRSRDQWGPLIMNHVLPSMARYMKKNFRVDPQDQEPYIEMLEGMFKWLDVLSPTMIGEVVVTEVFPMWHDALYHWLLLEDANYEEIGQWLEWWQESVFPDEIKALPSIAAEFEKGTALIERALDLGDSAKSELKPPEKGPALPTTRPSSRDRHHHKQRHQTDAQATVKPPAAKQPEEVTFRHVIEDWCQENDLQFIPERKRVHAEGPMYRITARGDGKGGLLVYFKGDILVAEVKNKPPREIRRDRTDDWGLLLDMTL